jgi:hypothetical protein
LGDELFEWQQQQQKGRGKNNLESVPNSMHQGKEECARTLKWGIRKSAKFTKHFMEKSLTQAKQCRWLMKVVEPIWITNLP